MTDQIPPPVSTGIEASDGPSIGIVCALHLEIAPFLGRCRQLGTEAGNGFKFRGCSLNGTKICVAEGGTGVARARQVTHALIDAFQPAWILSVGFSGALSDLLRVGDIVIADGIANQTGEKRLAIDIRMESSPANGQYVGHLCTTDHIVRHVDEKRQLGAMTGAIAVDMESFGVAQVCRERPTKFMSIRVISDDMHSDLPPEILAILGPNGGIRAGALVGSLLSRPGCLKDLWKLREHANLAAERLGEVLPGVMKTLMDTVRQP